MIFGLAIGILGLVLAIGAQTFAKPCDHDTALRTWLTVEGGLIAVLAGISMIKPNLVTQALSCLGGILTALTPGTLITICASEQMHCRMVTRPTALVIGIVVAVLACWWLALTAINQKRTKR